MKATTVKSDGLWNEQQLKYRLELLFGPHGTHETPLDDYLNYLDSLDLDVPFSFNSLIIIRQQFPVLKELIMPGKASLFWDLLENETDAVLVFVDPLLKGKNSVFFCKTATEEDDTRSAMAHWRNSCGKGKQGMILSESRSSTCTVVAVPGSWFSSK